MPDAQPDPRPDPPLVVDAFLDYHCPYSYRAVAWLDDLGPELVTVRHRLFALEQVDRDPDAAEWRLWEQPLDYRHYRDLPERRPLVAFLAAAIVEAAEPDEVARAFRLALYMARHDFARNVSDIDVVEQAGAIAGVRPGRIRDGIADPATQGAARRRIHEDWLAARSEYRIFGVPTLRLGGDRPFYLRLAGMVAREDGPRLLAALATIRTTPPGILEIKLPEPVPAG